MAGLELLPTGTAVAAIAHRAHAESDMEIDEQHRLLRTGARGYWTLAETEDYLAELAELMDECRRRFGYVRVLADRRGSTIESKAVAERLGEASITMFAGIDRLAVVVDSSVVKGQMRRRFVHPNSQAFLSYSAAELWLTARP